jgi:hypothetical protein
MRGKVKKPGKSRVALLLAFGTAAVMGLVEAGRGRESGH